MSIKDINDILSEDIKKIDSTLTKNIIRLGPTKTRFVTNIVVTGPAEVEERSSAQYICTAYYTDGTNEQVQADLWVENTIYATIDEDGLLTTLDVPNQDIPIIVSASYKGFTNSQPVSIRNVVLLTHIEITGPLTVEERGGDQYLCTAYYDNGNDAPVTPTWSDNSAYGNIGTDGYLTTLETPNQNEPCTISASYGGKTDDFAMTITNVIVLNSIEIEGPTEVDEDDTAQYNCRAYYDDGTSPLVTPAWSDNSPYASLDVNGLMTTGTVPQVDQACSVTANFGGKVDSLAMTIKNVKVLSSLEIAGPTEVDEDTSTAEYTLTAHYVDDPSELVNAESWSENSQYASINSSGQLTTASVPQGDQACTITANYGGQSDNYPITIKNVKIVNHIEITGSTSVNERDTSQYTATLYYEDDPSENITSTVDWSDDSSYASINSSGLLTTTDVGGIDRACEIMALYPGSIARCVDQVSLVSLSTPDALIPVDPTKVYTGGAYLRANSIDSILNVNKCYVGLTYYDVNKASLGTRWCFGGNVSFTSVGQIHHFYLASLTGEGATNAEFWVGARYVRFFNLLNYQCTGNGTAIMEILFNTFAEAATPNDNLLINPGFDQGGLNWQLGTNTIESSSQGTIDTLDISINNEVNVDHVEVTGLSNVDERGGSQYTATAYYDNGTNANVSSSVEWRDNSAYATVNTTGYLTTLETPNQDESCELRAVYSGKVLKCEDSVNFESAEYIPVNTSTTYYGEVGYRTRGIDAVAGLNRYYVGVRCYDESKVSLGNSYFVAHNLSLSTVATAKKLNGTITGEGVLNSQFRAGTVYVRMMCLCNYQCNSGQGAIMDNLHFKFTTDADHDTNLLTNWNFNADNEHWNNYNTNNPLTATGTSFTTETQGSVGFKDITIKNVVLLDHITITGSTSVEENSTAQYTCTAYYDDSSTANVTNSTTWGENSSYASISSTGLLTTTEVPSDQGAQITANYGGKGDTQNITITNVALIPTGAIIFSKAASTPSGWESFNSAIDRMIIGAGNSYSIGSTGGSQNISGSYTLGNGGAHTGDLITTYGSSQMQHKNPNQTAGAHQHTITQLQYLPTRKGAKLIRATAPAGAFPIDSLLLSTGSQAGLTNDTSYSQRYIQGSANTNDIAELGNWNSGSAGSHNHLDSTYSIYDAYGESEYPGYGLEALAGAHTSSGTFGGADVSGNMKKVLLSLWTHASQSIPPNSNMIIMWESLTPPDGWLICNGSNGTPDLRDCFIKPVNTGSENTTPNGDHTISISKTVTDNNSHMHMSAYSLQYHFRQGYHITGATSHNHALSISNVNYLMPYYALIFIMKS